jgi:hypothetical protein
MSGKGVIGSIIASIILSVSITGALGYFILPVVFPTVSEDKGILVQSIYHETTAQAVIYDNTLAYEKIPETELNITIRSNSRILATFSGVATLSIGVTLSGSVNFFVALVVEGVGNLTRRIHFFDNTGGGYGAIREYTQDLDLFYQTEGLPKGNYVISVWWKSDFDATDINQFILSSVSVPKTRALLVQEII